MLTGLLQLEDLNLSDNKIKSVKIPSNPQILNKLKNLDLSMNEISTSPCNLGRLQSLRVVDLNNNIITEMPTDLTSGFAPALKSASRPSSTSNNRDKIKQRGQAPTKLSRQRGLPGDPRVIMSDGLDFGSRDSANNSARGSSRRWTGSLKVPISHTTQATVSYVDDTSEHEGQLFRSR